LQENPTARQISLAGFFCFFAVDRSSCPADQKVLTIPLTRAVADLHTA